MSLIRYKCPRCRKEEDYHDMNWRPLPKRLWPHADRRAWALHCPSCDERVTVERTPRAELNQ